MIHFSELLKFAELYKKYLDNNDVPSSPIMVLKFLYINNLIRENKLHEFIKRESE